MHIRVSSGTPDLPESPEVSSSMSLKDQITEDMKTAMRARDSERLGTIRLLLAAIKQREIDERIVLDDTAVTGIVEKLIKQRRDSIEQFGAAGRDDLVATETAELAVLSGYMPKQLDDEEIDAAVAEAIAALQATGPQDMGKVMGRLKGALAGRADMTKVSARVKGALAP
jgi:uncharacterized protein YqeY